MLANFPLGFSCTWKFLLVYLLNRWFYFYRGKFVWPNTKNEIEWKWTREREYEILERQFTHWFGAEWSFTALCIKCKRDNHAPYERCVTLRRSVNRLRHRSRAHLPIIYTINKHVSIIFPYWMRARCRCNGSVCINVCVRAVLQLYMCVTYVRSIAFFKSKGKKWKRAHTILRDLCIPFKCWMGMVTAAAAAAAARAPARVAVTFQISPFFSNSHKMCLLQNS